MTDPDRPGAATRRPRAGRLAPDVRRGLIIDAAEQLLVVHDPLLVTFDEVAVAAGVSRSLVHTYLGDRRTLVDAVQVRIIGRLDAWVGHGLSRARTTDERIRAIFHGSWSFVESEHDAWNVLGATGGLDHPGLHSLRQRWSAALADGDEARQAPAELAVAGVLFGIGGWIRRGTEPDIVLASLRRLVLASS